MKFRLYREFGALNSKPVFDAFETGLKSLGHESVNEQEDVSVIWSVLWQGRMARNRKIYQACQENNKPIIIIEVGNFFRGKTWRVSLDNVNGLGNFANSENLDVSRSSKLGIDLKNEQRFRKPEILLATQHYHSLQWEGLPATEVWLRKKVIEIQQYTDRKIIVRPHPRTHLNLSIPKIQIEIPRKIHGSYDDYDITYNYHCIVNHNSGPGIQAALNGVPVTCDSSSLAYPVSDDIKNIENPILQNREEWFLKLCHTEWTVEEISSGEVLSRLLPEIIKKIT
jgi:hypothetical protein